MNKNLLYRKVYRNDLPLKVAGLIYLRSHCLFTKENTLSFCTIGEKTNRGSFAVRECNLSVCFLITLNLFKFLSIHKCDNIYRGNLLRISQRKFDNQENNYIHINKFNWNRLEKELICSNWRDWSLSKHIHDIFWNTGISNV